MGRKEAVGLSSLYQPYYLLRGRYYMVGISLFKLSNRPEAPCYAHRLHACAASRLQTEKLHKAINELPEKQKKRLILHYFQELTYVEIAEREKCSIRAVEYSVHGAIQSLKKFFEKN